MDVNHERSIEEEDVTSLDLLRSGSDAAEIGKIITECKPNIPLVEQPEEEQRLIEEQIFEEHQQAVGAKRAEIYLKLQSNGNKMIERSLRKGNFSYQHKTGDLVYLLKDPLRTGKQITKKNKLQSSYLDMAAKIVEILPNRRYRLEM